MKQAFDDLTIHTSGPGLYDITASTKSFIAESGINDGLLSFVVQHTSASLTIQENADPDVQKDLEDFFTRLVSRDPSLYRHSAEGPDDMPAHIRSALTDTTLTLSVQNGHLRLGTWQGIYLFEHRDRPHTRTVTLHILGN